MAVLIKANGEVKVINQDAQFSNEQIQKLLGGYYEVFSRLQGGSFFIPHADRDATTVYEVIPGKTLMLVDEDGIGKKLPFNRSASALSGIMVVGDALFVLRPEEYE